MSASVMADAYCSRREGNHRSIARSAGSSRNLPKEDMHLALPHLSDECLAFPSMCMGTRGFSGYVPWFVFSLISEGCPQLPYLRSFVAIVVEKFGLLYRSEERRVGKGW